MLVFSLDEFGKFEKESKNECAVIAGLVFDEKDEQGEEKCERERIEAFYRKACEAVSANYPRDLHAGKDNKSIIPLVKGKVSGSLAEFLKSGTYYGETLTSKEGKVLPERRGRYHLFAILKGKEEIRFPKTPSDWVKDDVSDNLYFHMASEFVSHMLFHNPVLDNDAAIGCYLPTRASADVNDSEQIEKFQNQGFSSQSSKKNDSETVYFQLMTPDVYRSLIKQEMLRSGKTEKKIESFKVSKIDYDAGNNAGNPLEQAFFYLSDSLCSDLQYKIGRSKAKTTEDWIKTISCRMNELIGDRWMLFGYDQVDVLFSDAWRSLEEGEYYNALRTCFRISERTDAFSCYYRNNWVPKILERIKNRPDPLAFCAAASKLSEAIRLNDKNNNNELYYIYDALNIAAARLNEQLQNSQHVLFRLYDAGVSICNHLGKSDDAKEAFNSANRYAQYVGFEEYCSTLNKRSVSLCDAMRYEEAYKVADENVGRMEWIHEVKTETLDPVLQAGVLGYGKVLSQRGQVRSFLRNAAAENDFRDALERFETSDANYRITQSYLLHFYLDNGEMRKEFLDEAEKYFKGKRTVGEQLDLILENCNKSPEKSQFNSRFALFVLVKGIYVYPCPDEMTDETWQRLSTVYKDYAKTLHPDNHPWELIFKYLCLISRERGDQKNADLFFKKMKEFSKQASDGTIPLIVEYAESELDLDPGTKEKKERELFVKLQKRDLFPDEPEENAKECLKQVFTYMYH